MSNNKDNLSLARVCFPVTLRCNLKCKLCAEHSPYYDKPYHPTLDELIAETDTLFELVDHIGKFDITGGEPFLRKDLPEFIRFLHSNYKSRVNKYRITTNGTLLPPDGFTEAAKLYGNDFYVIVDNYAMSKRSLEVGEILGNAKIPHEIRDYSGNLHCDGWVDYGGFNLKHDTAAANELYNKCAVPKLGFFTCMVDGRFFPCARARLLYEKGIADVFLDAFDEKLTASQKRKCLVELLGSKTADACKYCNGLCEDSERFAPAEQL